MPLIAKHLNHRQHSGAYGCLLLMLVVCISGCGFFGGANQLKQLQAENDRLLAEYRAQRDRATKLQETNAALEARVGEAERLLAQGGGSLPASRVSRLEPRLTTTPAAPNYPAPTPTAPADVKWRPMRRP